MGGWPAQFDYSHNRGIICVTDVDSAQGQMVRLFAFGFTNTTVWTAQRAVYSPITIQRPVTITHLIAPVATQAGNWNMGVYELGGTAIVRGTKAAVPVAGMGSFDITDTRLAPGNYFLALWCDSSTAAFYSHGFGAQVTRGCGVQQQTGLATDLPATATFATYATAVSPLIAATYKTTF